MNKIFISGRLTRDPEMKKTQGGIDYCNLSVAVDRPGTSKENRITDFFNCTVWGGKDGPGRAGAVEKYFHKGDGITITGSMQGNTKEDGDRKITYWSVRVEDFEFPLTRKGEAGQTAPAASAPVTVDENEPLPF